MIRMPTFKKTKEKATSGLVCEVFLLKTEEQEAS